MAQKNYEKLLTELMKKIPQNRLVKHANQQLKTSSDS